MGEATWRRDIAVDVRPLPSHNALWPLSWPGHVDGGADVLLALYAAGGVGMAVEVKND